MNHRNCQRSPTKVRDSHGQKKAWPGRSRGVFCVAHLWVGPWLSPLLESGPSKAGHHSSDPDEGGASLVVAKRTRRKLLALSHGGVTKRRAGQVEIDVAGCAMELRR